MRGISAGKLFKGQNPASSMAGGRVLHNIELTYGPDCYAEAIIAALNFNGFDGEALVGQNLGFAFGQIGPGDNFVVRAYTENPIATTLFQTVGIRITKCHASDWDDLQKKICGMVIAGQPCLIYVDTFFLRFFPKSVGHDLHVAIIHGVDLVSDRAYLKSVALCSPERLQTASEFAMPFAELRLGCNSIGTTCRVKNDYLEISFKAAVKEWNIAKSLHTNIKNMESVSEGGWKTGTAALRKFRDYLFCELHQKSQKRISLTLHKAGIGLTSVRDQRSRYCRFLSATLPREDALNAVYRSIGRGWDILRNMCLKGSVRPSEELGERLLSKIDVLVELETRGICELKRVANLMGS